jgi:hypothetical protein
MRIVDVLTDVGRPMHYFPRLAKAVGGVHACVFVCQMMYWRDKGITEDNWIWKTQSEIEEETGLSRWEQATVRAKLVSLGILEENYHRINHRMYFRIDTDNLSKAFQEAITSQQPNKGETANLPSECGKTTLGKEASPHSPAKEVFPTSGTPHSGEGKTTFDYIRAETTTEITKEIPLTPKRGKRTGASMVANIPELPTWGEDVHQALVQWADYRIARDKSKFTQNSLDLIVRKIDELGEQRFIAAVENSVIAGYQGLVEPKVFGNGNANFQRPQRDIPF